MLRNVRRIGSVHGCESLDVRVLPVFNEANAVEEFVSIE